MKKKKQRPQGFGEMKRGAGSPTSAKTGKSTKEAEITYGALVEEARICWMSGRTQEVISLLREAIAVNPKHPQAYYNLGNVLRGGDLQAAIAYYRKAIAMDPNHPEVYVNLGNALREQDDLQGAIDAYRQALTIKPTIQGLHFHLGNTLMEQGDLQGAIGTYRQALAIKPNHPEACYVLGIALEGSGDLQGAIGAYRQALAIKPNYPKANISLSTVRLLLGDYEDGWDLYEWRFRREKGSIQPHAHPQVERWDGHNLASG
ncbi:MAG: tetratricopeptide repeat protein, partial [Synechococcus sp. SB0668_bin_15]|nr:tetratricopeptide repeat protein [Synechococcus sp. SB0668_bin_15]MYC50405.1 tetratricopeptide repeat protein [Synechococcus sp. SB0662_bin_14]